MKNSTITHSANDKLDCPQTFAITQYILSAAVKNKATNIHISPNSVKLRCYQNLIPLKWNDPLPKKGEFLQFKDEKVTSTGDWNEIIVSKLFPKKEGGKPPNQGSFKFHNGPDEYLVRFNTIATIGGQSINMKILQTKGGQTEHLGIESIFGTKAWALAKPTLSHEQGPSGLILVSGPTGSGKTTILAELLQEAHQLSKDQDITTIEAPVERILPFARQIQVTPGSGQSYATAISSVLRMDPDIIMIADLQNKETIEATIQAALTGHIVIAGIHNQNDKNPIKHLIEATNEEFIREVLIGHYQVQLHPKLCENCKIPLKSDSEELEITKAKETPKTIYRQGPGCKCCNEKSYFGRIMLGTYYHFNKEKKKQAQEVGCANAFSWKSEKQERAKELVLSGHISLKDYNTLSLQIKEETK